MKYLFFLLPALVISPLSHAGLVTFSWTNVNSSPQLLSGSGFWSMDESHIIPSGFGEFAPVITDFAFTWTTIHGTTLLDPSNGFLNSATMSFDAQGKLLGFTVCASAIVTPCGFPVHPSFEIINGVGWGASISPDELFSVVFGNTPVTQSVSDVPEPGLLQLLVLGLLVLAWRYRPPLPGW